MDIPYGSYKIEIGESFSSPQKKQTSTNNNETYQTLRYDFKPKSVAGEQETYMCVSKNHDVQVVVPNECLNNLTIYKGSKKPIKGDKECILLFDHNTRQCRLEKLSSNINVKKTREINQDEEDIIKSKIKQVRASKLNRSLPDDLFKDLHDYNNEAIKSLENSQAITQRLSSEERDTSFTALLAKEAATSPSSHSSSSSSSSSTTSSDNEDTLMEGSSKDSNFDDKDVEAIEKMMEQSDQNLSLNSQNLSTTSEINKSVVFNDLYMSDGSESD